MSRVFTLKGALGVKSIRCDQGVRLLLNQRSRSDDDVESEELMKKSHEECADQDAPQMN